MEELLPDITINTKLDERTFISRLNEILVNNDEVVLITYTKDNVRDGEDSLAITPKNKNGNKNIQLLVFNCNDSKEKVFVELIADVWKIDPATYDLYSSEAKRILLPILKEYNRKYKCRIRLCIQSKEDLKIKLPKLAEKFFYGFTKGVYSQKIHPTDWKRFYRFIWHCHSKNVNLSHSELLRLLVDNNFDYDTSTIISERYKVIREFLNLFKNR